MSTSTKLQAPAVEIAKQIENGTYSIVERVYNKQFFNEIHPNVFAIKQESRLQIRDADVDQDFIEGAINKNTPQHLKKKTIIFFPNDVYETDGSLFARGGDYKIVGGNHTAGIEIGLEIFESDAYIVNFDTQLNGKISEAIDLGNLLNVQEFETRGTKKEDVKQIVIQYMAENEVSNNGDAALTEEQYERLLKSYPFITRATIGQWTSYNEKVGGRRSPLKTWTKPELDSMHESYGNQDQYQDYIIMEPRTLDSWHQTSESTALNEYVSDDNYNDGEPKKNKFLLIFYCSTQKQAQDLAKTKLVMRERYNRIEKMTGMQLKVEFLRNK